MPLSEKVVRESASSGEAIQESHDCSEAEKSRGEGTARAKPGLPEPRGPF